MRERSRRPRRSRAGIEEVNQAITQMDQVTQQNAALVEEAAAAAESMQAQAQSSRQTVSVFKLAEGAERPVMQAREATHEAPRRRVDGARTPAHQATGRRGCAQPTE